MYNPIIRTESQCHGNVTLSDGSIFLIRWVRAGCSDTTILIESQCTGTFNSAMLRTTDFGTPHTVNAQIPRFTDEQIAKGIGTITEMTVQRVPCLCPEFGSRYTDVARVILIMTTIRVHLQRNEFGLMLTATM